MSRSTRFFVTAALTLAAVLGSSHSTYAVTSCKAKIAKNGEILVSASGVVGQLAWASTINGLNQPYPLFNDLGTCVMPGSPKKCHLAEQPADWSIPPETCAVWLTDIGDPAASICRAYLKNCTPGRRPCTDDMIDAGGFCIDRYEASVWSGFLPGAVQYGASADDYPCDDNGQNCARTVFARSLPGVTPSRYVTWFQAQAACMNAGKRLPTSAEWQAAVIGTPDPGPDNGTTDCNTTGGLPVLTGSRGDCRSRVGSGAFDMVGNLHEWVADWLPATTACPDWGPFADDFMCLAGASTVVPAPSVLLRGGSFMGGGAGGGPGAGPLAVSSWIPNASSGVSGFRCAR